MIFKMSTKRKRGNPGKGAKAAIVALLLVALLAVSVNTEFAQLEPRVQQAQGYVVVTGDTIELPAQGVTGSTTGPVPGSDPGTMHVLYWMLLVAALLPLEIEMRKRNG